MSKIFDKLPSDQQDSFITESLTPGKVIRLEVDFKDEDKYLVLAVVDKEAQLFTINSQITKFKQLNPDLLAAQIELQAKEYKFLSHNSYIDCSELHSLDLDNIFAQVKDDYTRIKGDLSSDTIGDVLLAVTNSKKLSDIEKQLVFNSFK